MKHFLLLLLLLALTKALNAQNCLQNLEEAQIAYFNGRFTESVALLEPCAGALQNRQDQITAYELLAKNYVLLKNEASAMDAMEKLLKINPFYQSRPSLSVSLQDLQNRFRLVRQAYFGLNFGYLNADYDVLKYWSSAGKVQNEKLNALPGTQFSLWGSFHVWQGLRLKAGLAYQWFQMESSELQQGYLLQQSLETYQYWSPEIGIVYEYHHGPWTGFLGISLHYQNLISARADLRLDPQEGDFPVAFPGLPERLDDRSIAYQRSSPLGSWSWSLGLRYSRAYTQYEIGFAFHRGFQNMVNGEKRFAVDEVVNELAYLPDDRIMNYGIWHFGISRSIIKPKRIKS